jgi:hypothetical protein
MTKQKKKRDVPLINRLHIEAISALHAIVIITLIAATITFAVDLRWPELIFALTILGNQLLPARACILTYLENIWRIKAGIRPIKGWISHYILREYRKEHDKVMGNEVLHCGDVDDTIKEQLRKEIDRT